MRIDCKQYKDCKGRSVNCYSCKNFVSKYTPIEYRWIPYKNLDGESVKNQLGLRQEINIFTNPDVKCYFIPTKDMYTMETAICNVYRNLIFIKHMYDVDYIVKTDENTAQDNNGPKQIGVLEAASYLSNISGRLTLKDIVNTWNLSTKYGCENTEIKGDTFRNGEITIFENATVSPELIESAMNDWVDFFNNGIMLEHPFIKACVLHFSFVKIHPFCDRNGSIARLLMRSFLLRNGYDTWYLYREPSEPDARISYINACKSDYCDCTGFIQYMLQYILDEVTTPTMQLFI